MYVIILFFAHALSIVDRDVSGERSATGASSHSKTDCESTSYACSAYYIRYLFLSNLNCSNRKLNVSTTMVFISIKIR